VGGPGALNVQSGSDAVKTIPSYGDSGYDIHQDQPELVIEAIRQVVVGVRHPVIWYDLTSCCAK
jgi:hypothetical protein